MGADAAQYVHAAPVEQVDSPERSADTTTIRGDEVRRNEGRRDRGWLMRRLLLGADLAAILVSVVIGHLLFRSELPDQAYVTALLTVGASFAFVIGAKLSGLYDFDAAGPAHSTLDELVRIFVLVTVELFVIAQVTVFASGSLPHLTALWLLLIATISTFRAGARVLGRRRQAYLQRAVIVGAGEIGQTVARKIMQHPEYRIEVVGFVDADPRDRRPAVEEVPILGAPSDLPGIVASAGVDRVFVAFSGDTHEQIIDLVRSLDDDAVHVDIVPRLFDVVGPGAIIHTIEGLPLVGLPLPRLPRSSALIKRGYDLLVSSVGLVLLAPLLALVALAIKLDSKGPIFFRQVRIGSGNKPFTILKFRTMVSNAEELKQDVAHLNKHLANGGDPRMFKIPADPRCTRVGRLLRRFSIDELPQLLNVVRGQMTVVGPRPLIPEEHAYVRGWAERRLELKPGVTGLWQVLGRDDIPFEEMITLDYLYVVGWSLLGDIKLTLQTVPVLFRRRVVH